MLKSIIEVGFFSFLVITGNAMCMWRIFPKENMRSYTLLAHVFIHKAFHSAVIKVSEFKFK
ncbi:hypothetical protein LNI96_11905, partial [Tenacibaculum dicentrarchi]|nr:hypothetical protein [Tenacibaculum dicentrarchi]